MTATREDVIDFHARSWIGTPYHHQVSVKGVGADCLGLIRGVWRDLYGAETEEAPNYTRDWNILSDDVVAGSEPLLEAARRSMVELESVLLARRGDVLAFRYRIGMPAKHVAIVSRCHPNGLGLSVSGDYMIHALEGTGVVEVSLTSWWLRRCAGAFRFP